jgi:uncharacterized protein with HEPN domain
MDKKSAIELLNYIVESITLINERFQEINSSEDFLHDNKGLEKLDSISMRLQTIGEAVKNIYKRDPDILLSVQDKSYWSEIIRLREIISHHYIDIDSEIVYDICKDDIHKLKSIVASILNKKTTS